MMTETQIKIIRICIATMAGVSFYQALVIRRLINRLNYGRNQFEKLHKGTIYLLEVIEKNEIELTEFDLIALTAITESES